MQLRRRISLWMRPLGFADLHAVFLVVGQDFECRAGFRLQHLGRAGTPARETQRAAGNLAVEAVFCASGRIVIS